MLRGDISIEKKISAEDSVEGLGKASLGGSYGVVDAAAVAVAGDGAVGVPALAAGLRGAADAEALAAVVVGKAREDLLGGELGDLVCARGEESDTRPLKTSAKSRTFTHASLWVCTSPRDGRNQEVWKSDT
jgi:hypothetical protein